MLSAFCYMHRNGWKILLCLQNIFWCMTDRVSNLMPVLFWFHYSEPAKPKSATSRGEINSKLTTSKSEEVSRVDSKPLHPQLSGNNIHLCKHVLRFPSFMCVVLLTYRVLYGFYFLLVTTSGSSVSSGSGEVSYEFSAKGKGRCFHQIVWSRMLSSTCIVVLV